MNRLDRLSIGSRVFVLAAILGLSLALLDTGALQGVIFLIVVGGIALAADRSDRFPGASVAVAEGVLAAMVAGLMYPSGLLLLPYLAVPSLLAGVGGGLVSTLVVLGAESAALVGLISTSAGLAGLRVASELVAPWLLAAAGTGLLGIWLHQTRTSATNPVSDPSYESARRLLSQLRTVARRLSSGLDTVTMSSQILEIVHVRLDITHSALFVQTEGGVLSPLAYRGQDARGALQPHGRAVSACRASLRPEQELQTSGVTNRRHRIALPLRSEARLIGLVLADCAEEPAPKAVGALMHDLDEHSLRLDAALAFDEVRSMATMEERHRLAREIHDGVAQEIASLGYAVDDLMARTYNEGHRRKLINLRAELTRVVTELRLSIFDLRSDVNPTAGLGSALSDYVREVGARSGMTVHLTLDEAPTRLHTDVETELLRIAQEAITNARKHSAAHNLWVDCRIQPPYAKISVHDDGGGLGSPRADSYGLRIMRERAHRISADLEISDGVGNPPNGTTVTVTVGTDRFPV